MLQSILEAQCGYQWLWILVLRLFSLSVVKIFFFMLLKYRLPSNIYFNLIGRRNCTFQEKMWIFSRCKCHFLQSKWIQNGIPVPGRKDTNLREKLISPFSIKHFKQILRHIFKLTLLFWAQHFISSSIFSICKLTTYFEQRRILCGSWMVKMTFSYSWFWGHGKDSCFS